MNNSVTTEPREVRTRPEVEVECPRCGKRFWLQAETIEWFEEGGQWKHSAYGPASAECCGLAFLDAFGHLEVFTITGEGEPDHDVEYDKVALKESLGD